MSDADPLSTGHASNETSTHDSDHVNLRVTYLHAGNPRPPHHLGSLPSVTTIGALKSRLHNELLENPRPEEQRLIYQGRPLLQDDMTLREALRLEGPIGPLPYTLHIIIQPRQAASHFRPPATAEAPPQPAVNGTAPPMTAEEAQAQAVRIQAMAQAHLNMLQQQLAHMNMQHGLPPQQATQHFSASFQINGQPVQPIPQQQNAQPQPTPTTHHNTIAGGAQPQAIPGSLNPPLPQPRAQPLPPHALPLLNNLAGPGMPPLNAPLPRPLSVPPPIRPGDQLPVHIPHPPTMGLPFPPIRPMAAQPTPLTQPTVWLASGRNGPEALLFAPGHGFFSSQQAPAAASTRRSDQVRQVQQAHNARTSTAARAPTAGPANQAPANPQPAGGQLAVQHPGAADQARAAAAANEDFMGLVIQRGWLFLRLYMFTYVLSEPNTWRRYLLLTLALLVCLLPRHNPLNHFTAAVRRHIDNLIGPPHPQRPAAAAAALGAPAAQPAPIANPAAGPRPTPIRGAAVPTPEQAAARILNDRAQQRQQRDANPNVLRDIFYRVEQAVALFLASLIPGVGERHVAAREEQRRLELQAEMERVNAEREAQGGDGAAAGGGESGGQGLSGGRQSASQGVSEASANKEAVATSEAREEGTSSLAAGPAVSTGTDAVAGDGSGGASSGRGGGGDAAAEGVRARHTLTAE